MSKVFDEPDFRNKVRMFDNRFHAGELSSKKLLHHANRYDTLVLAIPAGGYKRLSLLQKD